MKLSVFKKRSLQQKSTLQFSNPFPREDKASWILKGPLSRPVPMLKLKKRADLTLHA